MDNSKLKITNEKPISLHPLTFDEAMKALIKTSLSKEEEKKEKNSSNHSMKSLIRIGEYIL